MSHTTCVSPVSDSLRPPRWPRQTCGMKSSQAFSVSPVSACPAASRAQMRAQIILPACWFASASMTARSGVPRACEHLIRRSGQVVQDRPSPVVGWADIPELSTCVGRRPAAWQQSQRNGVVGRTGFESVTSSVSGLLRDSAHVRQARSRCLRCCPRVAVVSLSRPPHRARGGHEPLRPELAALLDVWPSSQLAECAGGRRCWRLCGEVAVLCCCIAPASSARVPGTVLIRRPSAFQRRAGSGCRCCLGPSCRVARRRGCVVLASRCSVRVPVGRVPVR